MHNFAQLRTANRCSCSWLSGKCRKICDSPVCFSKREKNEEWKKESAIKIERFRKTANATYTQYAARSLRGCRNIEKCQERRKFQNFRLPSG